MRLNISSPSLCQAVFVCSNLQLEDLTCMCVYMRALWRAESSMVVCLTRSAEGSVWLL